MKSLYFKMVFLAALGVATMTLPVATSAQTNYTPYTFSTLAGSLTEGAVSVAVDGSNNVYLVNDNIQTVRKITSDGIVSTFAGSTGAHGTNDGTGSAARFNYPRGVAADNAGNVYVADTLNNTIRKVTPAGVVTTLAGLPGNSGNNNSPNARFVYPAGIAVDSSGNVYVGDLFQVRKITPAGFVTTLAGLAGSPGDTDGTGSDARFRDLLSGVAVDSSGNVYVADTQNHTIRKITPAGEVTTLAGLALSPGSADGTGSDARFRYPEGVGVDASGNVFVADTGNNTIRKITPDGVVTTAAGVPGVSGATDGTGSNARFSSPSGLTVNSIGSIFVAHGRIRVSWKSVNTWISNQNGKWEDDTKWSVGSPSSEDAVNYITNAATKIVTIDSVTAEDWAETLTINNLRISAPGSDINGLVLYNVGTATPLVVQDFLIVDSRGALTVTNSAVEVGKGLIVGRTNGNGGLVVLGGGKVTSQSGYVGYVTETFNNVIVSGAGAAWTNQAELTVGFNSSQNSLLIGFGGTVVDEGPVVVGFGGDQNAVGVTNSGSVWRNLDDVVIGGEGGAGNGLYVGSGGKVVNEGYTAVGYTADNNGVVVTDAGSLWQNAGPLVIGEDSGNGNWLTIANGGELQVGYANEDSLDIGTGGASNYVSVTGSGSKLNCSGPLQLVWGAPTTYEEFNGLYIADGGTVTTPSLVVSNGNLVALLGGTLNTGETIVDNSAVFPVGVGTAPATLHLNGGEHLFAQGLLVTSNALLTGCGVITGPVTVSAGGTVQVGAGCSLTFTGNMTNNGAMQTNSGSTLIFQGSFVNNGTIGNAPPPPACSTVVSGGIINQPENTTGTITDGTNFAQLNWSVAGPGSSGHFYATFNTHVAVATGVTNINQIFNAAGFTFATNAFSGVGPVMDAVANGGIGQFVILRNKNTGHYAAVRVDDVQTNDTLNATWWFQTSGGTNFSCLTPPTPSLPPVTNLTIQAISGNLTLSFATQPGRTYTVEMRTNLTTSPWLAFTNITGDGSLRSIPLPVDRPQGYYRILTQ